MKHLKKYNETIEDTSSGEEYQEDVDDILSDLVNTTGLNITIQGPYNDNEQIYKAIEYRSNGHPNNMIELEDAKKYINRFIKCLGDDFIDLQINRRWNGWDYFDLDQLDVGPNMPERIHGFYIRFELDN